MARVCNVSVRETLVGEPHWLEATYNSMFVRKGIDSHIRDEYFLVILEAMTTD